MADRRNAFVTRFGGTIRAPECCAPVHGSMAAGIDRIVMLLCGARNFSARIMPRLQRTPPFTEDDFYDENGLPA